MTVVRVSAHIIIAGLSQFKVMSMHLFIISTNSIITRVVGASQMTSQSVSSIFLCSPLPSGACLFLACPFPDDVFSPLFPSVFRPDEWETCPYHFSLRLFTMVRSSTRPQMHPFQQQRRRLVLNNSWIPTRMLNSPTPFNIFL